MLLSEQWVLATGGARKLGAAITRALVREGANVVVNYRKSEASALAWKDEFGDRARQVQADVTDAATVARLFEKAQAQTGPPMVSGELLCTTHAGAATPEFVFDLIASSTPVRRVMTPEECADAVLFFLSAWSHAVTGQNLIVDGGPVKG